MPVIIRAPGRASELPHPLYKNMVVKLKRDSYEIASHRAA